MLKDYINKRLQGINSSSELKNELVMWSEFKDEIDLLMINKKFLEFGDEEDSDLGIELVEGSYDIDDLELEEIYKNYVFNYKIFLK
jgi:hypothetical protein